MPTARCSILLQRREAARALARQAAAIYVAAGGPRPARGFLAGHRRCTRLRLGDFGDQKVRPARSADETLPNARAVSGGPGSPPTAQDGGLADRDPVERLAHDARR